MKLNEETEDKTTWEYGYVFLSDQEEADNLNVSIQTIKKRHKTLQEKGFLDIIEIDGKKVKRFNLKKLNGRD
jgi:DNA-binding transcriptional regulator YhcF (GntR family)